jgi:putative multiple sugar transport system permease protein
MFYTSLRTRLNRQKHGFQGGPLWVFILEHALISGLFLYLIYLLASYKGIPNVLVVMGILIAFFTFVTMRTTIGRRIYAVGGNARAAELSGVKLKRVNFLVMTNMSVLAALAGMAAASLAPATDGGAWVRSLRTAIQPAPLRAWLSQRDLPPSPPKSFRQMWRER